MKRLPKSKKIRLVINGVHFYTTVAQIREGIGDCTAQNARVQVMLDALEYSRHVGGNAVSTGMGRTFDGMSFQLDIM